MKARRVRSVKELKKGVTILTLLKTGEDNPKKFMYMGEVVKTTKGKVMIRPLASSDEVSLGEDARKDNWEVPVASFEVYAQMYAWAQETPPFVLPNIAEECVYEDYILEGPEVVEMLKLLIGAGNTDLIT